MINGRKISLSRYLVERAQHVCPAWRIWQLKNYSSLSW
ncbi:hypothetical protein L580_0205 [Serratia fonticola AU-P3(3)]|nr:hypothetical protein L580_0205 [Serratia fonticola AU-P3(3)]